MSTSVETFDPITRLTRDLREASQTMTADEARFLVDYYYIMQEDRIRSSNQIRSMGDVEPHEVLQWLGSNTATLERDIKISLEVYAENQVAGRWAMSVHGIGPVISAGLLAHIDIEKTPSVSALWSFAGMNPNAVWAKGKKRPWNAKLRVICWHAGECFKRTSGSPKSFYGPIYRARKVLEVERNDAGQFALIAKDTLEKKKIGKTTEAYKWYKKGMLPPGRLDLRATRYARKMFLSHYWQVLYMVHYDKEPPKPWILTQDKHVHLVPIPNWPMKA